MDTKESGLENVFPHFPLQYGSLSYPCLMSGLQNRRNILIIKYIYVYIISYHRIDFYILADDWASFEKRKVKVEHICLKHFETSQLSEHFVWSIVLARFVVFFKLQQGWELSPIAIQHIPSADPNELAGACTKYIESNCQTNIMKL